MKIKHKTKFFCVCVSGLQTRGKLTIYHKEKRQNQEMADPYDRKCAGLWFLRRFFCFAD